jgi:glycosyltransferase involved in cell wall biosynthesis
MNKLQIIVTSYQRPKYLKATIESLRRDPGMPVEVFVVDGGSDTETLQWISEHADAFSFYADNPGADFLKNAGIREFVTEPLFMVTSDDLEYPSGYAKSAVDQYRLLNNGSNGQPRYTFVACSMNHIASQVERGKISGRAPNQPRTWVRRHGVEILECKSSQVSGALLDFPTWERVGGFPEYGKSGQGDHALSKRLRYRGIRMCYLRAPELQHLGASKARDYPEYAAMFAADAEKWTERAKADVRHHNPALR